ncbi:MAG: 2Fe-2S iron-sulfur cluster binding domain-containing protein [Saprospiraceae bacterium]|nr:2Fe-2S iron-sulfur cluster binding domain-containing protein [Saprospiraceae bacterium]
MDYIRIKVIDKTKEIHELELPNDPAYSLMELFRACELPVLGTCGGMALCASCHIFVHSANSLPDIKPEEAQLLDSLPNSAENSRLSCQLPVSELLDGLICELAAD